MALFAWNASFSVGVGEIDAQHKKLIDLINDLHDAMKARRGQQVMGEMLQALADYTVYHFSKEEALMVQTGFPATSDHKAEHADFIAQISDIKRRYEAGETMLLSLDLTDFLRDWLTKHILGTDQGYAAHFKAKGVR